MEDQPTQVEAPERVVELDWWQGSNGRWFEGGNPEDEWGHPAPKVTGRRVVAALIDLIPLTILTIGLATRYGEVRTGRDLGIRLEGVGFLWFLIVFVILGFAAGMLNVIRTAQQMQAEAEHLQRSAPSVPDDDRDQ